MSQEVKTIAIKDLVLWTENPRDPIDETATDQSVVDRALQDPKKWALEKLAKEMGGHYDYSELPTVVYKSGKPVVYDGNRRVILGKIKLGLVATKGAKISNLPDFDSTLPCNVCSEDVAIQNVYRKHIDTGSWGMLERDIFSHKYRQKPKTPFLLLDEATGLISSNKHLNKRFVRDEIFNEEGLRKLGFLVGVDGLETRHSLEDSKAILDDMSVKVKNNVISTRKRRGEVLNVLDPSSQEIINTNKSNSPKKLKDSTSTQNPTVPALKQSKRTSNLKPDMFGGALFLKYGDVSDIYRDIKDLYSYYDSNRSELSDNFVSLLRMSLRLLCETAAAEGNHRIDRYVSKHFASAKVLLTSDQKTSLSSFNVTETSMVQLLQTGAHNYTSSKSEGQMIALSIAVGKILTLSHGKF